MHNNKSAIGFRSTSTSAGGVVWGLFLSGQPTITLFYWDEEKWTTEHYLFIPWPNSEALKKSFRYRGAVTWNSLSAEAKQATTLNCFYSAIVH